MKTKKAVYQVVWFSPRGFSNEGSYIYGTAEEIDAIECDPYQSVMTIMSNHRTLVAAEVAAEKRAKRDIRSTPSHEICNINHGSHAELY